MFQQIFLITAQGLDVCQAGELNHKNILSLISGCEISDKERVWCSVGEVKKPKYRSELEKQTLSRFGENLKSLRNARGFSQEEMAHLTGLSRSYYAELETGKRNVSLLNVSKILRVLKTNPDTLVPIPDANEDQ